MPQRPQRRTAMTLNPLVGRTPADTLENLSLCLDKLGVTLASAHDDSSIGFFCSSVSAALQFEAGQLQAGHAVKTGRPAIPSTSSG